MVSDGQRPLPCLGRHRSVQTLQDRPCIPPGEGDSDDLRGRAGLLDRDSSSPQCRRPTGGQRVAGDDEIVGDGTPLDVTRRAPRSVRKDHTLAIAVLHGVGVDKESLDPASLGLPGLEAAVAVGDRVADDGDLPLGIDPLALEPVVVLGVAAVGVDHVRGDIARARHAEVGGPDIGAALFVFRVGILFQRRDIVVRFEHLDPDLAWPGEIDLVLVELDLLQPVLVETVADVVRQFVVSLRSRRVGLGGEDAEVSGGARRVEQLDKLALDCPLYPSRWLGEPRDGWLRLFAVACKRNRQCQCSQHRRDEQGTESGDRRQTGHDPSWSAGSLVLSSPLMYLPNQSR